MPCENETHYLRVTEREEFPYPTFFSSLYLSTHYEIHWVLTDITMKNTVFGDVIPGSWQIHTVLERTRAPTFGVNGQ
jgi:hypothetical protein